MPLGFTGTNTGPKPWEGGIGKLAIGVLDEEAFGMGLGDDEREGNTSDLRDDGGVDVGILQGESEPVSEDPFVDCRGGVLGRIGAGPLIAAVSAMTERMSTLESTYLSMYNLKASRLRTEG